MAQNPGINITFDGIRSQTSTQTLSYSRATDSDMAPLAAHAWKSRHLVPVQAGHSDLYDCGCRMTLRTLAGLRKWSRPSASPRPWWQHRSWIINTDPSCSRARYRHGPRQKLRSRCHHPGPGDKQATNISPHANARRQVGLWMFSGSPDQWLRLPLGVCCLFQSQHMTSGMPADAFSNLDHLR